MTSLNEACGVFGIYSPSKVAVNHACFKGLYAFATSGARGLWDSPSTARVY
nr:hypothetical protein [uncultured Sphaerochaeta sp.]